MIKILFWTATGLVLYVYAGYPLLLRLLNIFSRADDPQEPPNLPTITLLVAAYNEADVIAAKLENALALDYPADRLEIVVASDGSKDATAVVVRKFAEGPGAGRICLLDFPKNRGKVITLNDAVPQLKNEIVAFSDASSMLSPDSLRLLAAHFADARVGGVSGIYRLLKKDQAALGGQEDFYWKYETFLKVQESRLGASTGAHGSLYAIRRALYPVLPVGTINDDFVIPMRIQQRGYRIGYETRAVAREEAHEMEGYSRRVRITAGNIEQLAELRHLLWPPRLIPLFCLISHKALRLIVPIAMLIALVTNAMLWRQPFYLVLLTAQILFYLLAAAGALAPLKPKFLRLPYYFCMINSALFAWMYHAVRMGRLIPSRVELDGIGKTPTS